MTKETKQSTKESGGYLQKISTDLKIIKTSLKKFDQDFVKIWKELVNHRQIQIQTNQRLDHAVSYMQINLLTRDEFAQSLESLPSKNDYQLLQKAADGIAKQISNTSLEMEVMSFDIDKIKTQMNGSLTKTEATIK